MVSSAAPTVFQNAPAFSKEPTPAARWDKIAWKLNTYYQHGGWFRDLPVDQFEQNYQYNIDDTRSQNNCYATALGMFVSGDLTLCPGRLPLADYADDGSLLIHNKASQFIAYDAIGPFTGLFEREMQNGLKADGVLKDVPLTAVQDYFPIIGLSYDAGLIAGKGTDLDFHFIVPHAMPCHANTVSYTFSSRVGRRGYLEYHDNEWDMVSYWFDDTCHKADLYLASSQYLGKYITVTDETYAAQVAARQRACG